MAATVISNLPVAAERIAEDIDALARITEPERPFTRRAFTPMFDRGRAWLTERFRAAGLDTHVDAAGNLIGRRPGTRPGRGTIMLGSHSDTVPNGGRFDGVAGVSAALEVARALSDRYISLEHDLEVVDFLAEEVSIFGVSCVGSRGMAGVRPAEWLAREIEGMTLGQGVTAVGGNPQAMGPRTDIKAFLELHIEQGPVLPGENLDIGVVTAIAGITRIEIVAEGRADHAGTTPMGRRQDALAAAARIVVAVEDLGTRFGAGPHHFAATVGEFAIEPNAANVVPSRARLLIDARAERRADMEKFVAELAVMVADIAAETGVMIEPPLTISDNPPTALDLNIVDALDRAAATVGARHKRMVSGAGHDTAWLARITKAAMIFIPCVDGRSHTPEEFATTADIALGAAVLFETVQILDRELV